MKSSSLLKDTLLTLLPFGLTQISREFPPNQIKQVAKILATGHFLIMSNQEDLEKDEILFVIDGMNISATPKDTEESLSPSYVNLLAFTCECGKELCEHAQVLCILTAMGVQNKNMGIAIYDSKSRYIKKLFQTFLYGDKKSKAYDRSSQEMDEKLDFRDHFHLTLSPFSSASDSKAEWHVGTRRLSLVEATPSPTHFNTPLLEAPLERLRPLIAHHTEYSSIPLPQSFPNEPAIIEGHENIDAFTQKVSTTGWRPPTVSYSMVAEKDLKHRIDLSEDGGFVITTSGMHEDIAFAAVNYSSKIEILLKGLSDGLLSFHRSLKHVLSKGSKRSYEVLLLGHRGYLGYVIYQFLSNYLAPIPLSPLEFYKKMDSELAVLIDTKINPGRHLRADIKRSQANKIDLKDICNDTVVAFFKKFINTLYETFEYMDTALYLSSATLLITSFHKIWAHILFEMMNGLVAKTKAECFHKKSTPLLSLNVSKELPALLTWEGEQPLIPDLRLRLDDFSVEDLWPILLQVAKNPQVTLFYEGQPLQALDSENFVTEFFLEKPTQDQTLEDDAGNTENLKNTNRDIDWFELHPKFFLNGEEIPEDQVRKMHQRGMLEWKGKRYLIKDKNLPSLQYLEKFWDKIRTGEKQKKKGSFSQSIYPLKKNQTLELLWLRSQGIPVHGDAQWQLVCDFYDSLDQSRTLLTLPESLKADLKPYQHIGVQWIDDLYHLGLGGILADDMGLGKTLQSLAFLENLRVQNKMGAVLVLVPATLIYNWQSEAKRFTPDLPLNIFNAKNKEAFQNFILENPHSVTVCSYGLFVEHITLFQQYLWNIHFYDEAQNLKNIVAKRTTACREVPARFKLCLTGTPLENHLGEFFSLVDLTVPEALGGYDEFRKIYLNPPEVAYEHIQKLKQKTKPLVLRRTKAEILKELPEKVETTIELPFEAKQKKIYRDIALSWNERVKDSLDQQGEAKSQLLMLTALLRLRQTCSDPAALPKIKYAHVPPKIETLSESLVEITESGESALVFTQFLATFKRIHDELKKKNIPVFCIQGSTSVGERRKNLESFDNYPKGAVMLMTLKSGGVGLNLVKASYVFHIEPWWNPAVENQASDRAHRIGQTRKVQIYRYIMKESVEEKIEILKERKNKRFQALFGADGGYNLENSTAQTASSKLTREDFDYLVGPV